MFSLIWQVLAPFLAALAMLTLLLVAFGSGTGTVELAIFFVVAALFGWWVARTAARKRHHAQAE